MWRPIVRQRASTPQAEGTQTCCSVPWICFVAAACHRADHVFGRNADSMPLSSLRRQLGDRIGSGRFPTRLLHLLRKVL